MPYIDSDQIALPFSHVYLNKYYKRKAIEIPTNLRPSCNVTNMCDSTGVSVDSFYSSGGFPYKRLKLKDQCNQSAGTCFGLVFEQEHAISDNDENSALHFAIPAIQDGKSHHSLESSSELSHYDSDFSYNTSQSTASSRSSSQAPECDDDNQTSTRRSRLQPVLTNNRIQTLSDISISSFQDLIDSSTESTNHFHNGIILESLADGVVSDVCEVAPITSFERGQTVHKHTEYARDYAGDNFVDQSSRAASTTPSIPSQELPSSAMETDDPSTQGDESSHTRDSSDTSDFDPESLNKEPCSDLEALLKNDILRADPDVAECFFQYVKGTLECASPDDLAEIDQSGNLSLFRAVELEAFGMMANAELRVSRAPVLYSASASSSSSQQSPSTGPAGTAQPSSNNRSNAPSGNTTEQPKEKKGKSTDQLVQQQKRNGKAGSSHASKPLPLRCIHNAIAPAIFCVNTQERFRSCGGPGWNSIQHLKEHMKTHHTKQVKNGSQLQCSRCQDEFPDQSDLKSHELDVDCPIRCTACPEEFESKALRQQHQKQSHFEEKIECIYMELDQDKWKSIKENLKAYTDSLKKGKGRIDSELENWVKVNTPRFEAGRTTKAKHNAKLELGQWYTIFKTLEKNITISEHPFYDSGIPHSEYAQEKLLYINDKLVQSRIKINGPPPAELDQQIDWFRDALRDSVRIAARTHIPPLMVGGSFVPHESDLYPQTSSSHQSNDVGYGLYGTSSSPLQLAANNNMSTIHLSPTGFLADTQHHNGQGTVPLTDPSGPTLLGLGMDDDWSLNSNILSDPQGIYLDTDFNYDASGSASFGNSFPTNWQEQHGGN